VLFAGDPTKLESYSYFGTDIHAVAEGPVVAVLDGLPEQIPSKTPTGLPLEQYGGKPQSCRTSATATMRSTPHPQKPAA